MYDLISFVSRGKIRLKILKNLNQPMTPTTLSEKIHTHRSTTSRAILSLQDKGLVECVTPKEKMGRLYRLTKIGKLVLTRLG